MTDNKNTNPTPEADAYYDDVEIGAEELDLSFLDEK